jgi:hypothetical protein
MFKDSTRSGVSSGPEYQDHGVLFCWEDGRPNPDTINPHAEGPFSVRERASGLGSGGRI